MPETFGHLQVMESATDDGLGFALMFGYADGLPKSERRACNLSGEDAVKLALWLLETNMAKKKAKTTPPGKELVQKPDGPKAATAKAGRGNRG